MTNHLPSCSCLNPKQGHLVCFEEAKPFAWHASACSAPPAVSTTLNLYACPPCAQPPTCIVHLGNARCFEQEEQGLPGQVEGQLSCVEHQGPAGPVPADSLADQIGRVPHHAIQHSPGLVWSSTTQCNTRVSWLQVLTDTYQYMHKSM